MSLKMLPVNTRVWFGWTKHAVLVSWDQEKSRKMALLIPEDPNPATGWWDYLCRNEPDDGGYFVTGYDLHENGGFYTFSPVLGLQEEDPRDEPTFICQGKFVVRRAK